MKLEVEAYLLSIVFVGDFNPVIIQPFWLAHKGLIREQEAEAVKVELMHNELVRFSLDWATIEVTKDRFHINTLKQPYFETVRDLASGIFKILMETPLSSLGINHIRHYKLQSEEEYYQFGNKLIGLDKWNELFLNPKLLQFELIDQERKDRKGGYVRIKIQPSDIIKSNGITINVNDHFSTEVAEKNRTRTVVSFLNDYWNQSMKLADTLNEEVLKLIK